jgi:hypothetical protein
VINRLYSPSYQRGRRLVAAGCPLDYLDDLPLNPAASRKSLYIRQLSGYIESRIFDFDEAGVTGYVVGLCVGTDLPRGIVISDWSFVAPWEHYVSWDYDAREIIPAPEYGRYASIFNSRLSAVLNDRRLLTRGCPVEGILCGFAFQSIPQSFANGETVRAMLSLSADTGHTAALRIALTVDRTFARTRQVHTARREGRLFDKPDLVEAQQMRRASPAVADSNSEVAPAVNRDIADLIGQYEDVTGQRNVRSRTRRRGKRSPVRFDRALISRKTSKRT